MSGIRWSAACIALLILGANASASAQFDEFAAEEHDWRSPQWLAFELRIGPYTPNTGAAFDDTFDDDVGPLLATELDVLFLKIKNVMSAGIGAGIGWTRYTADARVAGGAQSGEETDLFLVPIQALAVVRIEALPRLIDFPLVLAGKLGADFIPWGSSTGDRSDGGGVSIGLRWAVQAGLELDFFEPRAARALDEQWGINHTFVAFELFGSQADSSIPLGTDLAWTIALGFNM